MDAGGHILRGAAGADVGSPAQRDERAGRRHRRYRHPLIGEQLQRLGVKGQPLQQAPLVVPPARIGIDPRDQLLHRAYAVTDDPTGNTPRRRKQPPADDQQPVIVTGDMLLDDDLARTECLGRGERLAQAHFVANSRRHPPTLLLVEWLDDHRPSQPRGHLDGSVEVGHQLAARHRDVGLPHELRRQDLVLSDQTPDMGSVAGERRAHPLGVHTPPVLDVVRPHRHRDAALQSRQREAHIAGEQPLVLGRRHPLADRRVDVGQPTGRRCSPQFDQPQSKPQSVAEHPFALPGNGQHQPASCDTEHAPAPDRVPCPALQCHRQGDDPLPESALRGGAAVGRVE